MEIRLLTRGDEAIVEQLATREPRTALLQDPRTIFLVAFEDGVPPASSWPTSCRGATAPT